jgi:N utilization substance protein B
MGARSGGREAALQMLFAIDAAGGDPASAIRDFWRELPAADAEGRAYADLIVAGVRGELRAVDERIRAASAHWRIERMTRVDRNVLRIGTWELLHQTDVPRAVVIDEAVELAKRFGTAESGAFVNGVLDRIADDCGRTEPRTASGAEPVGER